MTQRRNFIFAVFALFSCAELCLGSEVAVSLGQEVKKPRVSRTDPLLEAIANKKPNDAFLGLTERLHAEELLQQNGGFLDFGQRMRERLRLDELRRSQRRPPEEGK